MVEGLYEAYRLLEFHIVYCISFIGIQAMAKDCTRLRRPCLYDVTLFVCGGGGTCRRAVTPLRSHMLADSCRSSRALFVATRGRRPGLTGVAASVSRLRIEDWGTCGGRH